MGYLNPRIVYCLNLPTGISEIQSANTGITVYPTLLAKGQAIRINSSKSIIRQIELCDATGKTIFISKNINTDSAQLNDLSLSAGIYFLKVITDNSLSVNKLIVE
jgi:hypothetical protein